MKKAIDHCINFYFYHFSFLIKVYRDTRLLFFCFFFFSFIYSFIHSFNRFLYIRFVVCLDQKQKSYIRYDLNVVGKEKYKTKNLLFTREEWYKLSKFCIEGSRMFYLKFVKHTYATTITIFFFFFFSRRETIIVC